MDDRKGLIDGEQIAEEIESSLEDIDAVLAIVLVGDNEASRTFVNEKIDACERNGFGSELHSFPKDVEQEELIDELDRLAEDDSVNGILVQLPLPDHIDQGKIFSRIPVEKDVDGLTVLNQGRTLRGEQGVRPAAVRGIMRILDEEDTEIEGDYIVIVNNSVLIGRPLSMDLTERKGTVTICHDRTKDLDSKLPRADIVITATGVEGIVNQDNISKNSVVIDAGYTNGNGDITDYMEIAEKARLSPVPGGLGPITVAMTLDNLVQCVKMQD